MDSSYISETIILLVAAVAIVPLFQYLKLGSILGFLAAGFLVGPHALGLIDRVEGIRNLSELGIAFLLFIVGIEIKPNRLWRMRHTLFGLGSAQVGLTTVIFSAIWFFWSDVSYPTAIIIGAGLTLSSTAFVLQLLAQSHELNSHYGRITFAVLLLQDLAVVPLLALIPLIGQEHVSLSGNIFFVFLEMIAILISIVFIKRHLLRPILRHIAGSETPEIFTAMAVLIVVGMAHLFAVMGLSLAMGAFIAGLLLANSEYRHQILADIHPFRGFLLGLFFMTVGMSLDIRQIMLQPVFFLFGLIVLIAVKVIAFWLVGKWFKVDIATSLPAAFLLSQTGEFAFIIFQVASQHNIIPDPLLQQLVLLVAVSMMVTPLLAYLARKINAHYQNIRVRREQPSHHDEAKHFRAIALIAGFGRVGTRIATILKESEIPYAAIDYHPDRVERGRNHGHRVYFGDAGKTAVLRSAFSHPPRVIIVAIDDVEAVKSTVTALRNVFPDTPVYARGHDRDQCEYLLKLGVSEVISETLEASLQLAQGALTEFGTSTESAQEIIYRFRQKHYGHIIHYANKTTDVPSTSA